MLVKLYSDCHLEFQTDGEMMNPGTGDVLVLAGDICNVCEYDRYHNFFKQCVAGYNKVFYVVGNHENYGSVWEDTIKTLKNKLPRGITLLHNSSEYYKGTHFVGATLWTNQNNLNHETITQSQQCMNDYHLITKEDGRNLSVMDTIDSHMKSREWFEQALPTLRGDVFMITHHAPSFESVKGRYVNNAGAYASDMSGLMNQFPSIKTWVHGHVHESSDYMLGGCRIVANPHGYHGMEVNPNFNPHLEIEV